MLDKQTKALITSLIVAALLSFLFALAYFSNDPILSNSLAGIHGNFALFFIIELDLGIVIVIYSYIYVRKKYGKKN